VLGGIAMHQALDVLEGELQIAAVKISVELLIAALSFVVLRTWVFVPR
jgi:hypothetical protein